MRIRHKSSTKKDNLITEMSPKDQKEDEVYYPRRDKKEGLGRNIRKRERNSFPPDSETGALGRKLN
ncbi:hypothetical protein BES34_018840 [Leptospira inadai serovar Lyme]|uniref:Uncharacterized protein n=1 Tax=Leptospira inadai serovar Lyme TaxID=293084 RepID=A0ABX4YDU8_9LEPT|nr:hypothetical protein BES34_018840 [Leptospira inadai serovar Lyme]